MPYFNIPIAFNDFTNGDQLQRQFGIVAVTYDHSGKAFLFSRHTFENLHLEPHFAYIPDDKLPLYLPLIIQYHGIQCEKPEGEAFGLLFGVQGILEEHGFPRPQIGY